MDTGRKNNYAEILLDAYNKGIFKIVWGSSGFMMAVDSKRKDFIPEVQKEDFVNYAFSVIKKVIDIADGRERYEESEPDIETARYIYEREYDLKNHLFIKRNSKIDCFKMLEYEIIAHRSEENPINIEADSAILRVAMEKNDEETSHTFEISRRDLNDIIDKLMELKEKMDIL